MSSPKLQSVAPNFSVPVVYPNQAESQQYELSSDLGSWVVLYFYPKDMTPGCTTQACDLRDHWEEVKKVAKVYGISPDSPDRHKKFIEKYELPFPLLSDTDLSVTKSFDLWGEKKLYGKTYMGVARSTLIINPQGEIAAILEKVKPATHSELVLKTLETLMS